MATKKTVRKKGRRAELRVRLSPPTHRMLVEMADRHVRSHQGELALLIKQAHRKFKLQRRGE